MTDTKKTASDRADALQRFGWADEDAGVTVHHPGSGPDLLAALDEPNGGEDPEEE